MILLCLSAEKPKKYYRFVLNYDAQLYKDNLGKSFCYSLAICVCLLYWTLSIQNTFMSWKDCQLKKSSVFNINLHKLYLG